MTTIPAWATRTCGEQDCNERPNRPNHPLCHQCYLDFQDSEIDECPNCAGVYKPSEYPVCRRCYPQRPQPAQATRTDGRRQHEDDSRGWNRQPTDEPVAAPPLSLIEAIELVHRNMTAHEGACVNHETSTIQHLIMPMLSGLGWDVYDPDQVIREYKPAGRDRYQQAIAVDIALLENGKPRIFVEAKRLDREYNLEYEEQLEKYASFLDDGRIAVLTNGRYWLVHEVVEGKTQHRLTVDVNEGAADDVARKLYNVIGRSAAGNAAVKAAPNRMPLHPATVFQPPRAATIVENLRQYRESERRRRGVPAYTIFKDETIDLIATQRPTDLRQLGNIRRVGQSTLQQHGDIIIKIVRGTADYTE